MVLFNTMDVSKRISEHDGEHVLVIHASMSFLGINLRSGHADFYVSMPMKYRNHNLLIQ